MGKTISITIPKPLEEELKVASTEQEVSRSRFICNILMAWSEEIKQQKIKTTFRSSNSVSENKG